MMRIIPALALAATLALIAAAQTFSAGDLTIGPIWTRATPTCASTADGYLRITNASTTRTAC